MHGQGYRQASMLLGYDAPRSFVRCTDTSPRTSARATEALRATKRARAPVFARVHNRGRE
eukprot:1200965-Pleurochrysis_carterae.AAC.1